MRPIRQLRLHGLGVRVVVCRIELGKHSMGVRPTKAETGHTSRGAPRVAWPLAGILHHFQVLTIKINVGVRATVVQRRRNHASVHG